MTTRTAKEIMEGKSRRFLEAEQNFLRLAEKIAPFVRRRKFEKYSTAGRWSSESTRDAQ
jgi:hypothetical protein